MATRPPVENKVSYPPEAQIVESLSKGRNVSTLVKDFYPVLGKKYGGRNLTHQLSASAYRASVILFSCAGDATCNPSVLFTQAHTFLGFVPLEKWDLEQIVPMIDVTNNRFEFGAKLDLVPKLRAAAKQDVVRELFVVPFATQLENHKLSEYQVAEHFRRAAVTCRKAPLPNDVSANLMYEDAEALLKAVLPEAAVAEALKAVRSQIAA